MNPILLQKQLRENASDLQDMCKDLKNWGDEMKRKESCLKNNAQTSSSKIQKTDVKQSGMNKVKTKKPTVKIGSTDYGAWEKFDADAECEKVDGDISEESELTDEIDENIRDEALVEKEKGNKFVKNQKWKEAIVCYTKAIGLYSYDPIFFANRALCRLKLNDFINAESDCNLSLKLDNTYVKAYQRRAAARERLNKLHEAKLDLLKVLELEPNNKESKLELDKIKKKLNEKPPETTQRPVSKFSASRNKTKIVQQFEKLNDISEKIIDTGKPKPPSALENENIIVKAINKPPHLRSKKPLKRILITETSTVPIEKNAEDKKPIKKHVVEKLKLIEKEENQNSWPKQNENKSLVRSDDFKVVERTECNIKTKEIKNSSNINLINDSRKMEEKQENELIAPQTSVQFYATWKTLKTTYMKYNYLKLIDPEKMPLIFQDSLDSDVLSEMLNVLATHFIENHDSVYKYVKWFTEIKRFSLFPLFMEASDRSCLWKLFDYIKENEKKSKEDVDDLISKYSMN